MIPKPFSYRTAAILAGLAIVAGNLQAQTQGQPPAGAPRPALQVFDTTKPAKLTIAEATGRYRVQEQLVGVNFLSDAVGTTTTVTGSIVIHPDGTVGSDSKITIDLQSLESDQEMRDGYVKRAVLEVDKFPRLEFLPKRADGLTKPLPSPPQAQAIGFQLVGDMTLHGVTKSVTWSVIGTLRGGTVAGRATTTVLFSDFNLMKPSVPLLLRADDKIALEIEFRCDRTAL